MAIKVTHSKVSTIPDSADTSVVRPSDWNDDHVLVGLGTMAEQNANSVAITGGTMSGVAVSGYVPTTETISAGTGLTGGGDLSVPRTLALANTAVTTGTYGNASRTITQTVDQQGRLTNIFDQPIEIANTQVTGLGTASTKDAGAANGVATLDATGKVPVSELPAAVLGALSYQGTWNAFTNTPTLTSSVGTKGYYYVVSVAGNTDLNGITDWQIGDWAVYNGTAWQKVDNTDAGGDVVGPSSATDNAIARFDTTTGKLIQNSAVIINDAGTMSGVESLVFDGSIPTATPVGTMWYDTATETLNFQQNNITQQIGEEIFVYGKASAAITDSPLQIIYHTGTVGSSGVITFAPTIAGITDENAIIGVATESIALNGFGRITSFGVVHGITTNGSAYGETWADDDIIWYNPVTGNPTKVKPVAPNIKFQIGTVISAGSGGSGSFQVNLVQGTQLGGTDSNVQLTSPSAAQLLTYSTTSGYWKNTSLAAGTGISVGAAASGVLTVTNSAPDQTVVLNNGTGISVTGTYPNFTVTNTAPSSGGTVTSVSGTAGRITSTGGTTPVIDLASGVATAGTTGSSTLIPVVTIDTYGRVTGITTAANPQGTVTSVTGTAPVVSSGGATPAISMAKATGSVDGYLSSTDWTTFNNKTSNTGTVTSVGGTGTVNGITLTGTVTTSGNLTLGGTLSGIGNSQLTNSAITFGATSQALGSTVSSLNGITIGNTSAGLGYFTTVSGSSSAGVAGIFYGNYQATTGYNAYGLMITGNRSGGRAEENIIYGTGGSGLQFGSWDGTTYTDRVFFGAGVAIGNTTDPGATNLSVTGTGKFGTTVGVGAATPSASGAGITFPATQSASTDPNTLDDYEEGTFVPTDASGAGLTFTSAYGAYTKIGRMVFAQINIAYPVTANTANSLVGSLPFTINTGSNVTGRSGGYISLTDSTAVGILLLESSTTFRIYNSSFVQATNANLSGKTFYIALTYIV